MKKSIKKYKKKYDSPSESVYKITGVRGSGKTVILAKIETEMKSKENTKKGWLVYDLNPNRDMLMQMAAMLSKDNFSANILGSGSGVGYTSGEDMFFDVGVEIEQMLKKAQEKKKKILIGIDEVSKTGEMIKFASEYGKWLRAGYPVYLVCTGLYENIQEVSNVKNLTFFQRATTIKTEPLNYVRMSEMYKNKLSISMDEAQKMAKITRGYAYAFQELGVLYFKKKKDEELSEGDRELLSLLVDKEEYKREEILTLMGDRAGNYSVYRDRLVKRGLIHTKQAYVALSLPYFGDYIKEYCM